MTRSIHHIITTSYYYIIVSIKHIIILLHRSSISSYHHYISSLHIITTIKIQALPHHYYHITIIINHKKRIKQKWKNLWHTFENDMLYNFIFFRVFLDFSRIFVTFIKKIITIISSHLRVGTDLITRSRRHDKNLILYWIVVNAKQCTNKPVLIWYKQTIDEEGINKYEIDIVYDDISS